MLNVTCFNIVPGLMKRIINLITCFSFIAFVQGQCPDREFLLQRMAYLSATSKLSADEKLTELLGYLNKINDCSYKNDSTHVTLLLKINSVYFQKGDYLSAVNYRRQAINIITANAGKPSVNVNTLPGIYYWLSELYDSLENFTERMRALDSCAAIAIRIKSIDRASLIAMETRVEYFFDIGDYNRCSEYALKCEQMGREYANNNTGLEKKVGEACALNNFGWHINAFLKLKRFEAVEEILRKKLNDYSNEGRKNYMALTYGQLAEVQQYKGNYEQALFYFNQSLKYYHETKDYFNCKQILNSIGAEIYYKHYRDWDKALFNYKKALSYVNKDILSERADVYETLNTLANMANIYVQKEMYDSAARYFQLAFDQIKPGSSEKDIAQSSLHELIQLKKIHYLAALVIDKGDGFRKRFYTTKQQVCLGEAIRIYKVADQLLDRVKAVQFDLQSKLSWRRESRRLYEHAIDACYLQGNMADAFYFFEKSRAVLLNDQLNEQRWMGENDILKQTQLKKKILRLERELSSAGTSAEQSAALKAEIFTAKQELDRLEQLIKAGNPLYYQSFLDTGIIRLQDVQQKLLKEHHALLEIFSGDSAVYALLVTDKNSYLTKINKQDYESTAGKYISYISNADLLNREFDGFVSASNHLYKLLFQNSTLPGHRIIISPDGQYFPFESLVTSISNQQPAYFLNDHAVSYTYSARFLMNDFNSVSATTGKNFMGIAPVNYPSAFSLAALPGSDQSLDKIAGYFDNAVSQVSSDASRNNFMQQFSQYRIIQLYTHAADSSSNNEPVIYFADSALYLSDLINEYKPLTRLIVLSACETGTGKNYQGEGVFSFNRGFAALGIPAAITNLWSVDNESTYLLTELFYKWLAKGLPTDVALQKAKLEFLKMASREKSMPCYWAGPVLVGKTDTIELSRPYPWKWIVLFVSAGCIVFWTVRKKVFSKKIKPVQILNKDKKLSEGEQFN
jgi:CHAT domain-containing protein